jgi:caffeoyl-CoA O-methyltransferase
MFHDIPLSVLKRMRQLEAIDARDRTDGTPQSQRLRQVPPETGRFLALMAAAAPAGTYLEIGTSAGYSALWLALACRAVGRRLVTFELLPQKVDLARETFRLAGVIDVVELIQGDARKYIKNYRDIAFCFLDAEKEIYADCYELIVPNMVKNGILVADNAINHRQVLQPMIDRSLTDQRLDALVIPLGKGELLCRKI